MILAVLVLLAIVVVLWIFSAPIVQWSRPAQSFDAVAFLGGHLFIVAIVGSCLLVLALIWLPKWQAARPELTPQAQFEVENNARKTLAEIVGGAALLAGLYFTWSSLEVSREGQITDRFTKAIAQLGDEKMAVRLGGIYALERIARDSEKDHWPIMEVLTAYVRERTLVPKDAQSLKSHHSLWVPKGAQSLKGHQLPQEALPAPPPPPPPELAADIQAILTVLRRRSHTYEKGDEQFLNLANTDLRGANLRGTQLQEANLVGAQLEAAYLMDAQLQGASLARTQLERAHLMGTNLKGVIFLTVEQVGAVNTLYNAHLADIEHPLRERFDRGSKRVLQTTVGF
jgi:hypothetical protein